MQPLDLMRAIVAGLFASLATLSAAETTPHYGPTVNLETAKKIAAGAMAEARKNNWNMAVAIVDNHGMLVYYEMMDDTQTASASVAIDKARTAGMWRRPSKDFEQGVAGGRVALLGLSGVTPIEGGLPIIIGGKVVGAVGVSGAASTQDAQCASAGLDTLK
jgi:uncharacterized protein GlcG (DUF336 family)